MCLHNPRSCLGYWWRLDWGISGTLDSLTLYIIHATAHTLIPPLSFQDRPGGGIGLTIACKNSKKQYLVRNISDPSPIRVQLHLGTEVMLPRHFSQLNTWVHLIHPSLTEEIQGSSSTGCVWDTIKAFVRGVYICEISKCKTNHCTPK